MDWTKFWKSFWQGFSNLPPDKQDLIFRDKDGKWKMAVALPNDTKAIAVEVDFDPWTGERLDIHEDNLCKCGNEKEDWRSHCDDCNAQGDAAALANGCP